jgi:aspartyl-tRNA(Asn)/glutamyl-tRNA(Gln) amidotransferase subunit A
LYLHQSIEQFHAEIAQNKISCLTVVQSFIKSIEENNRLNAFVEVFSEEAIERAKFLDHKKAEDKPLGKLYGVVVGIKDVICYENHPVSAASQMLKGFTSLFSATAIEKLLAEDAIIIGSLNCDEFAMGSSNENSFYGKVLNAIDEKRVPGGSSGGSAVAVQAGLCMVSLGSDTGGSVRQPADFCGIVGLKPSYGRISRHGLIAYASSFDQIGIFSQNVPDAALVLEVIAGSDAFDSTVSNEPVDLYTQTINESFTGNLAYFPEMLNHPSLDPEIRASFFNVLDILESQGHNILPIQFDYLDYIVPAYYVLTTAEASSNLARYDGIKYGYCSDIKPKDLADFYTTNRTTGFGKEVKRRIMLGNFVLSSGYYDAYFTKAQQVRKLIINKTDEVFSKASILLMPTVPAPAFTFGEKSNDPIEMFLGDLYTVFANLAGIPAVSVPIGKHSNGMPFGIQILSNRFEETALLQMAKIIYSK